MKRRAGSARRYAQALFEVALERDTFDDWSAQLGRVAELMNQTVAARLMASPAASSDAKRQAIEAAAGPLSPEVSRLVAILLGRKRAELLVGLADAFADRVREHRSILRADVTTAVSLGEAERTSLADRLERHLGRVVELNVTVDPEILGGVLARVGDHLIDGSLRGRLERLRQQLKAGAARS